MLAKSMILLGIFLGGMFLACEAEAKTDGYGKEIVRVKSGAIHNPQGRIRAKSWT